VETTGSRARMLARWTMMAGGARVLDLARKDLVAADPDVAEELRAVWPEYVTRTAGGLARIAGYFTIKDIAGRVNAGMGSLGTPRYYVLIEGAGGGAGDDRILDVKRQAEPSGYPYLD